MEYRFNQERLDSLTNDELLAFAGSITYLDIGSVQREEQGLRIIMHSSIWGPLEVIFHPSQIETYGDDYTQRFLHPEHPASKKAIELGIYTPIEP